MRSIWAKACAEAAALTTMRKAHEVRLKNGDLVDLPDLTFSTLRRRRLLWRSRRTTSS